MENEVDSFLENLNESKEDPFKESTEDLFESKEVKEEVGEDDKEKSLPFNKNPKIQRFIEKEIKKGLANIKPSETQVTVNTEEDKLTEILTKIIGNDTPEKISAVKEFRKELSGLEEKGAQKAIQKIKAEADAQKAAESEAQNKLNSGFEDIEETFSVDLTSNTPSAKKTRNDFIEFVKRIAPKDSEGQIIELPDLTESFTLFQERSKNSAKPNRAKELANRSMSRSSDASIVPQNTDKSWNSVDKLFSKFRN